MLELLCTIFPSTEGLEIPRRTYFGPHDVVAEINTLLVEYVAPSGMLETRVCAFHGCAGSILPPRENLCI